MPENLTSLPIILGYFFVIVVGYMTIILSMFNKIDNNKIFSINVINLLMGMFIVFGSDIKEINTPMLSIKKAESEAKDIVRDMEELKVSIKNINSDAQGKADEIGKIKQELISEIQKIRKETPVLIKIMSNDEKIISKENLIELNNKFIDSYSIIITNSSNKYDVDNAKLSINRYEIQNEKLAKKIDNYKKNNDELKKQLTILHE
jgi:hypothetical protein